MYLNIPHLLINLLPILVLCIVLVIGLYFSYEKTIFILTLFGYIIRILSIVLFGMVVLQLFFNKLPFTSEKLISEDMVIVLRDVYKRKGTFYGVPKLTQLAVNDEGVLKSKEAKIEDEPTMTTRGSIEGFYGNPWSHQDRLNQIEFYGKSKLNTYIYAPKDDVYHREKWRDPCLLYTSSIGT